MSREKINRISGITPIIMSLLAISIVLIVVTTGWELHLKDEGTAAHLFQLLIVAQVPFIVTFFATADWKRLMAVARFLAFQISGLLLALGSVAYFRL